MTDAEDKRERDNHGAAADERGKGSRNNRAKYE